jgi:DNA-binding HxlR family transcriptional regulator
MKHKAFDAMRCPIAQSLEHVGEWWSILILRDAFKGSTRFDQFQKSLGIAPNMLTRRLGTLVDSGLLERRLYSEKPPRHEYVLTESGKDFRPVLWALVAWGNKHFQPEGETMIVVDAATGEPAEPVLIDARSGRVLRGPEFKVITVPTSDRRSPRHDADSTQPEGTARAPRAKRKNTSTSS